MDQTKIYADTPVPYALAYLAEEIVHWCAPQAEELARLTQHDDWRDAIKTALHRHRDCKCGACATCLAAEELALAEAKL